GRGADVGKDEDIVANQRGPKLVRKGSLRILGDGRVRHKQGRVWAEDLVRYVGGVGAWAEIGPVGWEAAVEERGERKGGIGGGGDGAEVAAAGGVEPLAGAGGDPLGEEIGDEDRLVRVAVIAVIGDGDGGRVAADGTLSEHRPGGGADGGHCALRVEGDQEQQ